MYTQQSATKLINTQVKILEEAFEFDFPGDRVCINKALDKIKEAGFWALESFKEQPAKRKIT